MYCGDFGFKNSTNLLQNAMNAAEITDKLGLHSLRQRAWVRQLRGILRTTLIFEHSISNPPVLRREMVFMRVWSGLHNLSARQATSNFGVVNLYQSRLSFSSFPRYNRTSILQPLISIIWCTIPMNHSCLLSGSLP
jgi:hypothetical protein